MKTTATISPCGKFRYTLGRRWSDGPRLLVFVMLNPSTADASQDDATIRRCIGFAQAHGFDALEVVNLFAYRATKPLDLRKAGYPVGPDNDTHIRRVCTQAEAICIAWGANAKDLERPQVVLPMLRELERPIQVLAITKSGVPQHPLFIQKAAQLHDFTIEAVEAAMRGAIA